jgi:hypothetical protein
VAGQVVDAEQFIINQGKKTTTALRKQVMMPYIMTGDAAITLKTLGKIKTKTQDAKNGSNTFKKKSKMDQGSRNPNVSKDDPVGAMTVNELEMLIREHQTIMLVNKGGHSHMQVRQYTDPNGKFMKRKVSWKESGDKKRMKLIEENDLDINKYPYPTYRYLRDDRIASMQYASNHPRPIDNEDFTIPDSLAESVIMLNEMILTNAYDDTLIYVVMIMNSILSMILNICKYPIGHKNPIVDVDDIITLLKHENYFRAHFLLDVLRFIQYHSLYLDIYATDP